MELYYKDLISKEACLEELVDNLMRVVQGVDELAQAAGAKLDEFDPEEITTRLQRLKEGCRRLRQHAVAGATAADRIMRQYPYSTAGFAFAFGLLAAKWLGRKR